MKIFLSGSTSFLGQKFKELYSSKYEIIGFSTHDETNTVDMTDPVEIEELFKKSKPDAIVHLAAKVDLNQDNNTKAINVLGSKNLFSLAENRGIPVIFMSSEAVYGGTHTSIEINENTPYNPKSAYAEAKVESEKYLKASKLNYLILRGHRFVGFVNNYNKPKQFPDTINALQSGKDVRLDSQKQARFTSIDHLASVIDHYLQHDTDKQIILNCVLDKTQTYYELIRDVANQMDLNQDLVKSDGEEKAWADNSILNIDKLKKLDYPQLSYTQWLENLY